ncbi:DUF2786 domain-containing protein [Sphingopyxis sp. LARHCG72]
MIDRKIIDKIRKLLALGKGSTEHEAASALAKARALMDEHGITDAQLAMAEIEEATARGSRAARPPKWETLLARSVEHALDVYSFIDGTGKRTFIGRGPSAEIAAYAFAVLFRTLKAQRQAYLAGPLKRVKLARKRLRADVFCEGWAFAVRRKIAELVPERPADPLRDQYLAEHYPELSSVTARSAKLSATKVIGDFWAGHDAGREVDLHSGVAGAAAPLALQA